MMYQDTIERYFKRRNYKNCVIQKGSDKARNILRSQAFNPKTASEQTVCNFALILDYNPNFSGLPLLIRDHLKILFESPRMRKVFSQDKTCIRTGFRRTKNLTDMLVKSSVQSVTTIQIDNPGCFKCHRKVCDACQNFLLSLVISKITFLWGWFCQILWRDKWKKYGQN